MAAKDEKPIVPNDEPVTEVAPDEDDTEGHSTLTYEYTRQHAQERDREAVAWANREAVRKAFKNPIDRLRGR